MSASSVDDVLGIISGRWEFIVWTIPDFISTMNSCSENKYYTSPKFSSAGYTWYLKVCFKGCGNDRYMSVLLKNIDFMHESNKMIAILGIKKPLGIVEERIVIFNVAFNGSFHFIAQKELKEQESVLVPYGNLTLTCRIQIVEGESEDVGKRTTDNEEIGSKFMALHTLSSEFKDLFIKKKKCDITINILGKKFHAHKIVLMAKSSVFRAMYEHPTLESETGLLNIPDCDPGTFGDFLKYLYSGKLDEVTFETAYSLYSTSHKYDVQELKSFCIDYLKANLDDDNVCDVATLSDQYDEVQLSSAAQLLFNKNYKSIILTPKWKILLKNNYLLVDKLLSGMASTV